MRFLYSSSLVSPMLEMNGDDRVHALLRTGAFAAILTTGIWVFTDRSLISAAIPFVLIVVWRVIETLLDPYDIPSGTDGIAIGLFLTAISGSWLIVGANRPWLPVIAVVCGMWFTADGYKTYRDGPPGHSTHSYLENTESGIEAIQRVQQVGHIMRSLREHPQTPAEVAADVGISEKEAALALESLTERDMVEQVEHGKKDSIHSEIGRDDELNGRMSASTVAPTETKTHADTSGSVDANVNKTPSHEVKTQQSEANESQNQQILYRASDGSFSGRNRVMQGLQWIPKRLFRPFR